MNTYCPVCGSDGLKTTQHSHALNVIYSEPSQYSEVVDECSVCGESGDFSNINDEVINNTLDLARKKSVLNMLEYLSDKKITMSYIERSLELPARTIARWKTGEFSSSSLALLRIVRTYPWILEVADERFNEHEARNRLLEEASYIALEHVSVKYVQIASLEDAGIKISVTMDKKLMDYSIPEIYETLVVNGGNQ